MNHFKISRKAILYLLLAIATVATAAIFIEGADKFIPKRHPIFTVANPNALAQVESQSSGGQWIIRSKLQRNFRYANSSADGLVDFSVKHDGRFYPIDNGVGAILSSVVIVSCQGNDLANFEVEPKSALPIWEREFSCAKKQWRVTLVKGDGMIDPTF